MKLLLAIINHDDAGSVMQHLMQEGFFFTKLSSSGGFLRVGNTTILIGTDESKVDTVVEIIGRYCRSRTQVIPTSSELGMGFYPSMPVEVVVGGATIFVLNVERFEKV